MTRVVQGNLASSGRDAHGFTQSSGTIRVMLHGYKCRT